MFKKIAVALVAATMLTAPALAQGGADTKTGQTPAAASTATTKVVAAKPKLKSAKVKAGKRYAVRHHRHVRHVAHVKHVKYVKSAAYAPKHYGAKHHVAHVKHAPYVKSAVHGSKHHVRHVVRKPAPVATKAAMSTAKPKSGTN
jgi:hypothetical protein